MNLNPIIKKEKKDKISLPDNKRSAVYVHINILIYTRTVSV